MTLRYIMISLLFCVGLLSTASSFAKDASDLYATLEGSVFPVYVAHVMSKKQADIGTAVAVSPHYLVTNCHVVGSRHRIFLGLGDRLEPVSLVYGDLAQDVCVLYAPKLSLKPVTRRASSEVRIGERVYVIGNPRGTDKSMSEGIVSNKVSIGEAHWLQTDAAVNFGSSGGGLFDQNGHLIGVLTAKRGGFGYALPEEWVSDVLREKTLLPYSVSAKKKVLFKPQAHQKKRRHDAVRHLSLVKHFGAGDISFYDNSGKCFLFFIGRDKQGKAISSGVWVPSQGGILSVFPGSANIKQSLWEAMRSVMLTRYEPHRVYASQSVLTWQGVEYPLLITRTHTGYEPPFFTSPLPYNTLISDKEQAAFTATFRGKGLHKGSVRFDMTGFMKAVSDLRERCGYMFD